MRRSDRPSDYPCGGCDRGAGGAWITGKGIVLCHDCLALKAKLRLYIPGVDR